MKIIEKNDEVLLLRLPSSLLNALREVAERQHMPVSKVVRQIIQKYVERCQK